MNRMLIAPLVLAALLGMLLLRPQSRAQAYQRPPLPQPVVLDEVGELPPGTTISQQPAGRAGDGLKAWR